MSNEATQHSSHCYTSTSTTLRADAQSKKSANVGEAEAGALREARTVAYITKNTALPMVAFNQGFAAGESGRVEGLPTDKGIEPALSDIRLERVGQANPAHVHIEVSGTSFSVKSTDHFYVKAEKLRQQARSGDDKLVMLVYDKFRTESGQTKAEAIMLRVPREDLKPGGALDVSGTARELQARFPENSKGVQARYVKGQLMICLPHTTEYRMTRPQFIAHIEKALGRDHFDKLTPAQQTADREFHAKLQADKPLLTALNDGYLKERSALTLAGGKVATLDNLRQIMLRRIGSLNSREISANYEKTVGAPAKGRALQACEKSR